MAPPLHPTPTAPPVPPSTPLLSLSPAEITGVMLDTGVKKVGGRPLNTFLLGILAGAFIAFASEGSNMAAFNLFSDPQTYGLGKALAGAIFPTGLILVVVAGGELFTGNTMLLGAVLEGRVRWAQMLRNWGLVYAGNFVGSILIAHMMVHSGLYASGDGGLGGITVRIAAYKTHLPFLSAFYLGVMCNWLVCLAVWMAYGARDIAGKALAIFFPIWLFITSGFEHSVANMYYIPAGIWAKTNPDWAAASGVSAEKLAGLNWQTFAVTNLLPVTLGNVVGGAAFVAGAYWLVYRRNT